MKIKILEDAQKDLFDGASFYEEQSPNLGEYFLDTLFSDIESLHLSAGVHMKIWGYHRLLSKRFPYAVYYRVKSNTILIFAIPDCRRDPIKNLQRLK